MNNQRRRQINNIVEQISALTTEVETLRDEEGDAYHNLPESIQNSERGSKIDEASYALECAEDSLIEAIEQLEEAAQ